VFRSLMAKRLIEMKRYRGAFVAPRNQWNYLDTDVLQWVLENDYDPRLIGAMSEYEPGGTGDRPLGSGARNVERSGAD
jgi:DNA-binding FadR family transcriptional regulator